MYTRQSTAQVNLNCTLFAIQLERGCRNATTSVSGHCYKFKYLYLKWAVLQRNENNQRDLQEC